MQTHVTKLHIKKKCNQTGNLIPWKSIVLGLLLVSQATTVAIQNFNRSYFYRSSSLWAEPRFEQPYLSTLTCSISGGNTHCGSDCSGNDIPIVRLTQHHPWQHTKTCTSGPNRQHAARWTYIGSFEFTELNVNAYQSIGCNTFVHLHIPVLDIKFSPGLILEYPKVTQNNISLAPQERCLPAQRNAMCLTQSRWDIADTTLFFGFTRNSYAVSCLDFVDYTIQAGILFPTSSSCCSRTKLQVPYGYNKRWGATAMVDLATGLFNWITLAMHADATLLTSKTTCLQDYLADAPRSYQPIHIPATPVTRIGALVKADHLFYGLSLALGVSHEKYGPVRYNSPIPAPQKLLFCEQLQGWSRSIFHVIAELDAGKMNCFVPECAFSYHHQLSGRNVFNTNVFEGTISLNMLWQF